MCVYACVCVRAHAYACVFCWLAACVAARSRPDAARAQHPSLCEALGTSSRAFGGFMLEARLTDEAPLLGVCAGGGATRRAGALHFPHPGREASSNLRAQRCQRAQHTLLPPVPQAGRVPGACRRSRGRSELLWLICPQGRQGVPQLRAGVMGRGMQPC